MNVKRQLNGKWQNFKKPWMSSSINAGITIAPWKLAQRPPYKICPLTNFPNMSEKEKRTSRKNFKNKGTGFHCLIVSVASDIQLSLAQPLHHLGVAVVEESACFVVQRGGIFTAIQSHFSFERAMIACSRFVFFVSSFKDFLCHAKRGPGFGPADIEGHMRNHLGDLGFGHAVLFRSHQMMLQR